MFDTEDNNRPKRPRSLLDVPADVGRRPSARSSADGEKAAARPRAARVAEPHASVAETVVPRPPEAAQTERPLFDLALILRSVWQVRYLVIGLTVAGAIGGATLAVMTPSSYVAESKLYVDPREVRLTDSDLSKQSLATEGILALVDSQIEVLRSRDVLERVVRTLGLERDAEFGTAVTAAPGGFGRGIAVMKEIVFGKAETKAATPDQVDARTMENLAKAVTVARDPKTFIVSVSVKSRDPSKSARIVNQLVSTFLDAESAAQADFFQRTTEALDGRIAQLRKELDIAEKAVETYKAENDIVGAAGELISDKQLLSLNDQVGGARTRMADARAKAELAAKIQLNDVLSGAFPEELASPTLAELRKQYAEARARLGALDASLGPRHPQRLAAEQSLDVSRSEIGNELRRIAATAQTEYQRAQAAEADLMQQLNVQKSRQVNASNGFVELRELERKAAATQVIYENFLKRVRETGEEEKLTSKNIRVISAAEPPLQPVGPSRKLIAIGGMLAGFAAGIGVGVALGMIRSLRALFNGGAEPSPVRPQAAMPRPLADPVAGRRDPAATPRPRSQPLPDEDLDEEAVEIAAPAAPARSRGEDRRAGAQPESVRAFRASDHSLAALNAARGAARPTVEATPPEIAEVRDTLRALRSRVETYARQQSARRG
ncbi:GumC family protein [Ensifer soli]|uniref:GumC family protein n=1 Tax=Ciceribacter sp. sgz301302 TaxID=3342379 RepID=UPI0035B8CA82